jgi:hypothetical protein
MPDKDGDPRDSMIGLFSAVRQDYGPGGVRVELGHVGILPVWGENNRNEIAAGKTKTPVIRPVLIDREMPKLQARLDELDKLAGQTPAPAPVNSSDPGAAPTDNKPTAPSALTADQQKEFIEITTQLKLLSDRRQQILARTGDDYVADPPKLLAKP